MTNPLWITRAKWASKGAEQGNGVAQVLLAAAYATGEGVAKDYKQAMAWYQKAAEQGRAVAQFQLGVGYANGFGVAKDGVKAYAWYALAASNGYSDAEASRLRIHQRLNAAELQSAEALLSEWKQKYKPRT